jgi:2-polyprenyl-6-hydroxyphenyl methylase/3-demethylubiquinone-9 3-methyltransferase
MTQPDIRFSFGANWRAFLDRLDDERIAEAEKSLQLLLDRQTLDGLNFLDIGSGSGLFSLAARRLGARVRAFDYDIASVECAETLKQHYIPGDSDWIIERASVLDTAYLDRIGNFDVVYSWGVLHHTGAMHIALEHAASRVSPGGLFAFALYRKTLLCRAWTLEKRWYAQASPAAQQFARAAYERLMRLGFLFTQRDFKAYVDGYRSNRGMDFHNDIHDWMGGYPYESIRPSEIAMLMKSFGFEHMRSVTRPYSIGIFGSGCDEYVYRRRT